MISLVIIHLSDAKMLVEIQEKLNGLVHAFEDIMSSSSNNIGYIKVIEMDIETYHNLLPVPSKPYTLPLKYQELSEKSLKI